MNRWWVGVLLHLAGFVVLGVIAAAAAALPTPDELKFWLGAGALLGIGVVQCLWALPLVAWGLVQGHKQLVWGVAVPAALVFLLNTACWGVFAGEL